MFGYFLHWPADGGNGGDGSQAEMRFKILYVPLFLNVPKVSRSHHQNGRSKGQKWRKNGDAVCCLGGLFQSDQKRRTMGGARSLYCGLGLGMVSCGCTV